MDALRPPLTDLLFLTIYLTKYINLIIYIIYHRVKHKKSVFMRVCKLLHLPTGENGHLPTGENEEKASFAYGGK